MQSLLKVQKAYCFTTNMKLNNSDQILINQASSLYLAPFCTNKKGTISMFYNYIVERDTVKLLNIGNKIRTLKQSQEEIHMSNMKDLLNDYYANYPFCACDGWIGQMVYSSREAQSQQGEKSYGHLCNESVLKWRLELSTSPLISSS